MFATKGEQKQNIQCFVAIMAVLLGSAFMGQSVVAQPVELAKIQANDLEAGDNFGCSVSINGARAIVGANGEDTGGGSAGAAYIFELDGSGTWVEVAKIQASDIEAGDVFGSSVSVSGHYAIVGAPYHDSCPEQPCHDTGAVYVFECDDSGTWGEVDKITLGYPTSALFGTAVSISGDRDHIVGGAPGEYYNYSPSDFLGSFFFDQDPIGWSGQFFRSDASGLAVSISGDYFIFGAGADDSGGTNAGAAYIFEYQQPNQPPVANAGIDQTVYINETAQLDGSASGDPDNDPLVYNWQFLGKPDGSNAVLSDPTIVNPSFIADMAGKYVVELIVNDGTEDSEADVVIINASKIFNPLLFATNSINIGAGSKILSGDIVVNEAGGGTELQIGKSVEIAPGYEVKANRINVETKSRIASDVFYNQLTNHGDISGSLNTPLNLPVFATLPSFVTAPAGNNDFTVPKKNFRNLPAGDYRDIRILDSGTLVFNGGVYNLRSLDASKSSNLLFASPCEIHISNDIFVSQNAFIGAQNGLDVEASDVIFYVDGSGSSAVNIGQKCEIFANIYVSDGDLEFKNKVHATGSFIAQNVIIGKEVQLTLDSYFVNGAIQTPAAAQTDLGTNTLITPALPEQFSLEQNYPNPFNPTTTIRFTLPEASRVSLRIYNNLGQLVKTLLSEDRDAGYYNVVWDTKNANGQQVSAGVYLYRITAGNYIDTKKMILMK